MSQISMFSVLGPVMVGPSSSHTAGAVRLGRAAHMLGGTVKITQVDFLLHGSFAKTYRGHGTDRALVGGILGMEPDDERIKNSLDLAREQGLAVSFSPVDLPDAHPNTVQIKVRREDGSGFILTGASIGGGSVRLTELDGVKLSLTGDYASIMVRHADKLGMIHKITGVLAGHGVNIVALEHDREARGGGASTSIQIDGEYTEDCMEEIRRLDGVSEALGMQRF